MGQLHVHARRLLGLVFSNEYLQLAESIPWATQDLHTLRRLGEQAGPHFQLAANEIIDALDQAGDLIRRGGGGRATPELRKEYREVWHRAASGLDKLASEAEINGL